MAVDFQQVRQQIIKLGQLAPAREIQRNHLRQQAWEFFNSLETKGNWLVDRVKKTVIQNDPAFRCALPILRANTAREEINSRSPVLPLSESITLLAADGSQVLPDRHQAVDFCLINVGAISMKPGTPDPPVASVLSELLFDEKLYSETGKLSDASLALMRDLSERKMILQLSEFLSKPVISITDGPMELWRSREVLNSPVYNLAYAEYMQIMASLMEMEITVAGYVDKPASNLVVRLLEAALLDDKELQTISTSFPFQGVSDFWLFRQLLKYGERSAIFEIQSQHSSKYPGMTAVNFFYLNVGSDVFPWIARVELPSWVAQDELKVRNLQSVLVEQCKIMGTRYYPYILHRAHETAVVTGDEKDQVTRMIYQELQLRGVQIDVMSQKQMAKELAGKKRFRK